jgi:ribonuclease HI
LCDNRAYQGPKHTSSVGGILYFGDNHYIKVKANVGPRTNNFDELMTIKALVKLALDQGISQIYIFSNSQLDIKWLNNEHHIQSLARQALSRQLKENFKVLTFTKFSHVYIELNTLAYALLKEGLQMIVGQVHMMECFKGTLSESRMTI